MSVDKKDSESKKWWTPLEKGLPWGIVGAVLGLGGLYVSIRDLAPSATLEILSVSNVFDVHRPLPDLTVAFKGEDVQKSGRGVRVVTLSLANLGDKNIVQGDYDQEQPFGFSIPGAQIVGQPRVVRADSEYLATNLRPKAVSDTTIEFSKVILEKGQSAVFEFVVLQERTAELAINPSGKIAGQRNLHVRRKDLNIEPPMWRRIFDGGFLVNLWRLAVAIVFLALALIVAVKISDLSDKRKKRRARRVALAYIEPILPKDDPGSREAFTSLLALLDGNPARLKDLAAKLEAPGAVGEIERLAKEHEANKRKVDGIEVKMLPRTEEDVKRMDEEAVRFALFRVAPKMLRGTGDQRQVDKGIVQAINSFLALQKNSAPPANIRWWDAFGRD